MRASLRRRLAVGLLALFVLLTPVLAGCTGDAEVVRITRFTLETPLGVSEVRLPAHIDDRLPAARARYVLRTQVALPEGLRNRDLTLAMGDLMALAAVRAGGREAVALDVSALDTYRSAGHHRWRIASEETRGPTLDLAITVEHTWVQSAWLDLAPTLSATPAGDPAFVAATAFDIGTAWLGLTTTLVVSVTYGLLFVIDRRRRVHAWHGLQGIFGSVYPALPIGLLQPLLGTAEVPVAATLIAMSGVASVHFVSGMFERPRPTRAWWLLVAAPVALGLAVRDPFRAARVLIPCVLIAVGAAAAHGMYTLVKARREGPAPLLATLAALGFPITAALGVPDMCAFLGLGDPFGGLRGGSLALGVVSLLQAGALSRNHVASLRHADELNAELGSRVVMLEANYLEIRVLNDELRRQVGANSQRLGDALARLGPGASAPRAFVAGDVIDERYRVVRRIGEGGMGTVYEVARAADGRRLALKVLQGARSGAELARLAREAEVASHVDSPHVVGIVDVDVSTSGAVFLVMEYVDGPSLDELDARYGDAPWALHLLAQIAEGLAALHAKGIVHRDLKPGNVLVTATRTGEREVAKIADFGISMRPGSDDAVAATATATATPERETTPPADATDRGLTRTGQVLGTPMYMAPELARGARHASAASDVYALGVVAFELLTGQLPHGPEAARLPPVAPLLAVLLQRCLALDPAARPTARAVADALAADGRTEAARGIPAA